MAYVRQMSTIIFLRAGRNRADRFLLGVQFLVAFKERMLHEPLLTIEGGLAGSRGDALICAISSQLVSVGIIGQQRLDNLLRNHIAEQSRFDGDERLYAIIEVALHHIGATDVYFGITVIAKVVNAAVFQEATHDTAHANGFANAWQTRTQAADAAHNQIDWHTGLRGAVEQANNIRVGQRIHLKDQVSIAMLFVQGDLALNALDDTTPQADRRN